MSGGLWHYINDDAAREVFGWKISVNYGEKGFSLSDTARKLNPLEDKLVSELVWDVFCLLHSYDWYVSGDTCEETYRADCERFKSKWFNLDDKKLVEQMVANAVSDVKDELYTMFRL